MPKNRFYCPDPLVIGSTVNLPDSAVAHAIRVLRMVVGDEAILFNGDGFDYKCTLSNISKHAVLAEVKSSQKVTNESPLNITLLQGISSGDRMDYTIQKAVELGVNFIQPLATLRSVVKLDQTRAEKRVAHWQQVVYSACEQSGRAFVPIIGMPKTLSQWLANHQNEDAFRVLLNPIAAKRYAQLVKPSGEIQLLIGAEGGLSQSEIDLAIVNHFQSVVLGPRILRTETAALAAIASMHAVWGDF